MDSEISPLVNYHLTIRVKNPITNMALDQTICTTIETRETIEKFLSNINIDGIIISNCRWIPPHEILEVFFKRLNS